MAKGAGVTPFTRPISWCAGLELTSLSGAEAEGRTGPLGALWGGERPFRRRCTSRKNSPPPSPIDRPPAPGSAGLQASAKSRRATGSPPSRTHGPAVRRGAVALGSSRGLCWTGGIPPPGSPRTTPLTLVLEVLQDGDDGLQGDVVRQEELPGTVLLKGFPVQALDCGQRRQFSPRLPPAPPPRLIHCPPAPTAGLAEILPHPPFPH